MDRRLVRHGLIAPSYVPPQPLRELRDLLRYRRKLVEGRASERNRLLKLLETANIKLASVMSDVFGVSGLAILKALVAGETSPVRLVDLAKGPLRKKRTDLIRALEGKVEEHHRFLMGVQLRRLEAADHDIAVLDERITERLKPYAAEHALLMQIPGVDGLAAAAIIAEIGVDMAVFLSAHHLAAWAGCARATTRAQAAARAGERGRAMFTCGRSWWGAAISARRCKGSYLRDKYHRLKARRGALRAALAVAHNTNPREG